MERYAVEKIIGEGTYGIVYKAVEKVSTSLVGRKHSSTVVCLLAMLVVPRPCSHQKVQVPHRYKAQFTVNFVNDILCIGVNGTIRFIT